MVKPLRPMFACNRSPLVIHVLFRSFVRRVHQSHGLREAAATAIPTGHQSVASILPVAQQPSQPPLSLLPFKTLVRSYLINLVSSNRFLLPPSLKILSLLAYSESPYLNPDRNPILRYLLKKTFYAQFCGGETRSEIQETVDGLKEIGFSGVILAYAKEIVVHAGQDLSNFSDLDDVVVKADVESWKQGNLKTIDLTSSGQFVGLKYESFALHAGAMSDELLDLQVPEVVLCSSSPNGNPLMR